jgi:hypothetical protein
LPGNLPGSGCPTWPPSERCLSNLLVACIQTALDRGFFKCPSQSVCEPFACAFLIACCSGVAASVGSKFYRRHLLLQAYDEVASYYRLFAHEAKATLRIRQKARLLSLRLMLQHRTVDGIERLRVYALNLLGWQLQVRQAAGNGHLHVHFGKGDEDFVDVGQFAAVFLPAELQPTGDHLSGETPVRLEPLLFSILDHANDRWTVKNLADGTVEHWTMAQHPVEFLVWDSRETEQEKVAREESGSKIPGKTVNHHELRWHTTHRCHVGPGGAVTGPNRGEGPSLQPSEYKITPTPYTPKPVVASHIPAKRAASEPTSS